MPPSAIHPFMPVPANHPVRRGLDPFCMDHVRSFGLCGPAESMSDAWSAAIEGRSGMEALVKANQMLALVQGTAYQINGYRQALEKQAFSANEGATLLTPDITSFTTQQLHMVLDIFPMLMAPKLMSVQPLTQPSAYVFYMKGVSGETPQRDLANLSTFNKTYAKSQGENTLIPTIKKTITKALVEAEYYKLRYELSWEAEVAMRSQYALDPQALMDPALVQELAWEVDRVCIDRLIDFAGITYYFDPTNGNTFDGMSIEAQRAYEQKFVRVVLNNASTDIERAVYRSPGWAICGSNVIKWIKRLPSYTSRGLSGDGNMAGGQSVRNGSIIASGEVEQMQLWHDPQLDTDLMLIGHTEQMSPFYAGFIFSPFGMASMATAAWMDPDYMTTKKSRALAFTTKGISANQYAKIYLRRQS